MRIVTLIIRAPVWPFIWLFRLLTGDADWASVHARILPFGSAIGTYLVANLLGDGKWAFWNDWDAMMAAAGLGVIFHGIAAVVILEGGIKMGLYVVDKWKADRARMRAESRAEGLAEGLAEGRATGLAEGRATGLAEGRTEGLAEGRTEGRASAISDAVDLLRQNPEADPMAVLEQLRRESRNGKSSAE